MNKSGEDFERELAGKFRSYVERGIGSQDPQRVEALAKLKETPRLAASGRALAVSVFGAALIVIVGIRMASDLPLGANPTGEPSVAVPSSAAETSSAAASPSPAPSSVDVPPTITTGAWTLTAVEPPTGHPSIDVLDVSGDGGGILFHDSDSYEPLFFSRGGAVVALKSPTHGIGVPVFGRLSPKADFVIFDDGGELWKFGLASNQLTALPGLGGMVAWYTFTGESSVAVLTSLSDTPRHQTQLWLIDTTRSSASKVGAASDAQIVYSTALSVVLGTDISPAQDNSDVLLQLVAADGTSSVFYDAGAAQDVAVSPTGDYVALSGRSNFPGVWLVAVATNASRQITREGTVTNFSPDGSLIAIDLPDGTAASYTLSGALQAVIPDSSLGGWVLR